MPHRKSLSLKAATVDKVQCFFLKTSLHFVWVFYVFFFCYLPLFLFLLWPFFLLMLVVTDCSGYRKMTVMTITINKHEKNKGNLEFEGTKKHFFPSVCFFLSTFIIFFVSQKFFEGKWSPHLKKNTGKVSHVQKPHVFLI